MGKTVELSIVATIYNDYKLVVPLVDEIETHIKGLNITYEIILVNDSSTDSSELEIRNVCDQNKKIKGISLARNFGQQIAISAGMYYTKGNYIIIMDGDLQNPPSEIPKLYNEILKGYDIVYTVAKERDGLTNSITSKFFWFLIVKIFNVSIVKNQLMMKIMTNSFVSKYIQYSESIRSVEAIVRDISSNYSVLEINNNDRKIGRSHYNFLKRFNLFVDMLISLTNTPLNIMIYFGLFIFICTMFLIVYNLYMYIIDKVPPGFTSLVLSICFFGSLIILLLGFIGRYLSNIYTEVRRRPLFNVKNFYNLDI